MEADDRPYAQDKSVETVPRKPRSAKYTLATNAKGVELGIKDFKDIAAHKDELDGKIYGIEPGNDGNRLIIDMSKRAPSISRLEVVEYLRAGMLAGRPRREVRRPDRLPRMGTGTDERHFQAHLSFRWR